MQRTGILLAAILVAAIALAQEPPKPGPEHKKLDVFVGSWTLEGDIKPGTMGPGGKMTETETCQWLEGGFFLVCHTEFKSATMGSATQMSIRGYSSDEKSYTYRDFNSWGETMDSKGAVSDDTWIWTNDEKKGDTTVKARFTVKLTSPTAYIFTYETSPDGNKWTLVADGKATKK